MGDMQRRLDQVDDRQWLGLLAGGLVGLLVLRLVALALNRTDLFFDEAQYWFWSLEPAFGYYSKPPLIAWIIGLSTGVCGVSEFCVRLPSPFLHTVTALGVFLIGRQLYDTRTGVIASAGVSRRCRGCRCRQASFRLTCRC